MLKPLSSTIQPEWKRVSSRWGHPLHSLCSYMATFPPSLPHYFIHRFTNPGDIVLDPFSGRGTTPLQACLTQRIGIGNDLNPLAFILTQAKVRLPNKEAVLRRIAELEQAYEPLPGIGDYLDRYDRMAASLDLHDRSHVGAHQTGLSSVSDSVEWDSLWTLLKELREIYARDTRTAMPYFSSHAYNDDPRGGEISYSSQHHHPIWIFYHPETLRQLAWLKHQLDTTDVDIFIAATVLGIMHGRGKHYLSVPMPNTFSMTPRYVLKFVHENRLVIGRRSVFDALRRKLALTGNWPSIVPGVAIYGDVRRLPQHLSPILGKGGVNLVVTSPPYLKVVKYGQYNWLRLWFIEDSKLARKLDLEAVLHPGPSLDRRVDATLDDGHGLGDYLSFMRETMEVIKEILRPDGTAIFVIGDVEQRGHTIRLAEEVWQEAAKPAGLHLEGILAEDIEGNRKVTKIWGERRGRATMVERSLIVSRGSAQLHAAPVPW